MQCPSCGFQNLPGLATCARCASPLVFADVDVHPYRAGTLRACWHRVTARVQSLRADRWMHGSIRERSRELIASEERRLGAGFRLPGAAIVASLVPGLGLMLCGRRRLGAGLLAGYVLAAIGALLFMADAWFLFYGIMLSLHAYSIVALLSMTPEPMRLHVAILTGFAAVLVLQVMLYWPLSWVAGRVVWLQQIAGDIATCSLVEGDVLAVEGALLRPDRFEVGQIVSYAMPAASGSGWYTRGGTGVDRILAGPGDLLDVRSGIIHVNGVRIPIRLHTAVLLPSSYGVRVPQDTYFIYPSSVQWNMYAAFQRSAEAVTSLCLVPQASIIGRVRGVVSPLSRWGRR